VFRPAWRGTAQPTVLELFVMNPELVFWPGTTVVTFMVRRGEEQHVMVLPPARFLEGLRAANAMLALGEIDNDEGPALQTTPDGRLHTGTV
jgi:hypothetical protein